jgi:hypothetical protein
MGASAIRFVFVLATPVLVGPLLASMLMSMQSFQQSYSEALCRMESVRVHAIEDIENDEPIEVDFGGDECLTPMLPTVEFVSEVLAEETPEATPTPTP